jgi:hypothetical protein
MAVDVGGAGTCITASWPAGVDALIAELLTSTEGRASFSTLVTGFESNPQIQEPPEEWAAVT